MAMQVGNLDTRFTPSKTGENGGTKAMSRSSETKVEVTLSDKDACK